MPKKKSNKPSSRIIVRGVEYVKVPRKKGCEDCVAYKNADLCGAMPNCMPNIMKAFKFRVKPDQDPEEVRASLRGTSLTRKQIADYKKDSSHCPRCYGSAYTGESLDVDNGCVYQNCSCSDCGLEWTDEYKLSGFTYQEGETDG